MRYLVAAENDTIYRNVSAFLMDRYRDNVRVASEKRRFLSVENLPDVAVNEIREQGASVEEEFQYDLECSSSPS